MFDNSEADFYDWEMHYAFTEAQLAAVPNANNDGIATYWGRWRETFMQCTNNYQFITMTDDYIY